MMAQPVPHQSTDKKRVKVYELRNNDWFDRGTGFCTATIVQVAEDQKEPRVVVESEDHPDRILLETRICKEDGFQKQQETLIVWTEPSTSVDMALSFQEPEGCALIWKFVNGIQQTFQTTVSGPDDSLSDDLAMDLPSIVSLPAAELGSLAELESNVRIMSSTANGRDALAKAIMNDDYIRKLLPLVEMAEDLESLDDLHRLCNIMKTILLLNDTGIIEHAVSDDCVIGVVGALEYDPDFPSHKANHRQWLNNQGRYKEVVKIEDDLIRRKIHQTYRLQYLKDVVLARILDDPTFSVLNSLIFFNQVDIVTHLQSNGGFLSDLFGIFIDPEEDPLRKKEAVLFIQQCCAIAKNLQPPARQSLYNNFLSHGLLHVINFGLRNADVAVRVGATDILVAMIDHDPQMIRQTIYRQIHENQVPLTDTLIELILVEVDLGIKSQVADALKVLLDPSPATQQPENFTKANGEFVGRRPPPTIDPQQDGFLAHFYQNSAPKLFRPLFELEARGSMKFSIAEEGIFPYLHDILTFYVRHHHSRSKFFVLSHSIVQRFGQLLACGEKHLQLVTIRFFRALVGFQDEFYVKQIADTRVLGPVLELLGRSVRRDNLLVSACLDLFEYIKKENIKDLVKHLVENHRDRITILSYIDTFRDLLIRYDQSQGYATNMDGYFIESEEEVAARRPTNANTKGMMEHITVDPVEEDYWNASDDEDEQAGASKAGARSASTSTNGATAIGRPLVDYTSDSEGDEPGEDESPAASGDPKSSAGSADGGSPSAIAGPPERLSEKRRREEDEEDEIGKLAQNKRRNSSSASMNSSSGLSAVRKRGFSSSGANGPRKIAISISPSMKTVDQPSASQEEGS